MKHQTQVIETRQLPNGLYRRRRETLDGRRYTTVEVPLTVLRAIGMPRVDAAIETWQRGEARRARALLIRQRVREGVKPTAIADEFGITEQRVRQVRQEMQQ